MFSLRASAALVRTRVALPLPAAAAAPASWSACVVRAALPASAAASSCVSTAPSRSWSTATSFFQKKQKEWRTRAARGFAALKTHAGCKKRFRFVGRFGVVCKHSGKHHKNFHKDRYRLSRLRRMKLVPRHLVKRLKVMMPYWKRQMQKERTLARLATEPSVTQASSLSWQRQRVFIEAQQERLTQQLLNPKPYFPRITAREAMAKTAATAAPKKQQRA